MVLLSTTIIIQSDYTYYDIIMHGYSEPSIPLIVKYTEVAF